MSKSKTPTLEELEKRIRRLRDVEEVEQLMARYAQACDDTYNLDRLMPLFADKPAMNFPTIGRYEGTDAIRRFWETAPTMNVRPLHFMLNPMVDVADDGRTARGSWYLWEESTQTNPETGEPEAVWIGGVYDNSFVLEGDRWKIKEINLRFEFLSPYVDGWQKTRFREMAK